MEVQTEGGGGDFNDGGRVNDQNKKQQQKQLQYKAGLCEKQRAAFLERHIKKKGIKMKIKIKTGSLN